MKGVRSVFIVRLREECGVHRKRGQLEMKKKNRCVGGVVTV
jgi:hypothetical protein